MPKRAQRPREPPDVPSAFLVHIPARLSRQIIERMERREWLRQQIAGLRGGIKRALNQWKAAVSALKPLRVVGARWMNATMYAYFRYWTCEYRTRMQVRLSEMSQLADQLDTKALSMACERDVAS